MTFCHANKSTDPSPSSYPNMKLKYSILLLTIPACIGSLFRLPKWLFNPLVIRLTGLPFIQQPLQRQKVEESNNRSCGSTLTKEINQFLSPNSKPYQGTCRSKIQISRDTCSLKVKLKKFRISGSSRDDDQCMSDKFWITTELTHGEGVRSGAAGVICGHRDGAEIHVPVSHTSLVYLNFKIGLHSYPNWDIEVVHQKCEENLVRKYGLLDSVNSCLNRRESRKNAKATFRRMKKYLFGRRRGGRHTRSVLDWVFNFTKQKQKEISESNVNATKMNEEQNGEPNTIIDTSNVRNTPSEFFQIATSSDMELSRFSSHYSGSVSSSENTSPTSRKNHRNYKRRKSLFNKSKLTKDNPSSEKCPVYLYSDSHGLTCMCKS